MDPATVELSPGQFLKIKTVHGESHEGVLLADDRTSQCLLLQEISGPGTSSLSGPQRTVLFLRRSGIKELAVTPKLPGSETLVSRILEPPRFDLDAVESRERSALKKAEEEARMLRQGVSAEAMELFSALAKTMPVAWEKTTILVLGEVRIASPYLPQSVTGGSNAARDRVKMVLMRERERLGQRAVS